MPMATRRDGGGAGRLVAHEALEPTLRGYLMARIEERVGPVLPFLEVVVS